MDPNNLVPDDLLERARHGDGEARNLLLEMYRSRLRQMIDLRLDRRLRPRVDPSDVVQEALAEAYQHLDEYLEEQPVPFYPWLRQIAFNRLLDLHRRHLLVRKRSARREIAPPDATETSVVDLADWLIASVSSPSHQAARAEERDRVQTALLALAERDREILLLRYMEMLSTAETASVLNISEGAVKVRLFRALEHIRALLPPSDGGP